jgi:hypothetical protein
VVKVAGAWPSCSGMLSSCYVHARSTSASSILTFALFRSMRFGYKGSTAIIPAVVLFPAQFVSWSWLLIRFSHASDLPHEEYNHFSGRMTELYGDQRSPLPWWLQKEWHLWWMSFSWAVETLSSCFRLAVLPCLRPFAY